jgi:hypothetical protein
MRPEPRVLFALSVSVAVLIGGYACSSTFPNKLSVYDPDGGAGATTFSEDSSVPADAADAHAPADGGDAASAKDAGGAGDAGDAGSVGDGTAPLDAGDAGLGDGDLEDASDLDGAAATG